MQKIKAAVCACLVCLALLSLYACAPVAPGTAKPSLFPSFQPPVKQPRELPGMPVGDVKIQLAQADQYYKNGDFNQAKTAYLEVLKGDDQQPIVYYRLGNIAFYAGEYKKASSYYQQSLELMPNNSKAHYNLAVTYLSLAEQHFKFYTATLPPDTDVSKVSRIIAAIHEFAGFGETTRDEIVQEKQHNKQPAIQPVIQKEKTDSLESLLEELAE